MQAPGNHDLTIYQGASFDTTITWKVGDPATAVNLSGYTAKMQIRESLSAESAALELTTGNGRIALGGTAGTIALAVTAADTAGVPAGVYVYDLELVSGGGQTTRLLEGVLNVDGEVTR